jgi:hypothetical protein
MRAELMRVVIGIRVGNGSKERKERKSGKTKKEEGRRKK